MERDLSSIKKFVNNYNVEDKVLCQYNKSSMLLETNGRGSSGKRTRHVDVRYFFIADRVKSGQIRIEHCPTGIVLADYFTKALQGALFTKLRNMIMGKTDIPLPSDVDKSATDPSTRISDGLTNPKSRSALKNEIAVGGSPRALTVLPVCGSDGRKTESVGMKSSKPVTSTRACPCTTGDC